MLWFYLFDWCLFCSFAPGGGRMDRVGSGGKLRRSALTLGLVRVGGVVILARRGSAVNLPTEVTELLYFSARLFRADSSSPQVSAILVDHFTQKNDSLSDSPQNFSKNCAENIKILARETPFAEVLDA